MLGPLSTPAFFLPEVFASVLPLAWGSPFPSPHLQGAGSNVYFCPSFLKQLLASSDLRIIFFILLITF